MVVLNKKVERYSNVPFGDTSKFPITLLDDAIDVKGVVDFDEGIREFVLDLNGEPLETLVYLDPTYDPDNKEVKTVCAYAYINNITIFKGTLEW